MFYLTDIIIVINGFALARLLNAKAGEIISRTKLQKYKLEQLKQKDKFKPNY